jgi:hypothetical protein
MYCDTCINLFLSARQDDYYRAVVKGQHHMKTSSWDVSIQSGCQLCILLRDRLLSNPEGLDRLDNSGEDCDIQYRLSVQKSFDHLDEGSDVTFSVGRDKKEFCGISLLPSLGNESKNIVWNNIWGDEFPESSADCVDLASKWIADCHASHPHCAEWSQGDHGLPGRLILVGASNNEVRLVETKSMVPVDTIYMTLSHCWGKLPIFTLLSARLLALQQNIPTGQLARVFQHAIDLTRKFLGSKGFIWIDCLCIVQDSREDWLKESAKMGDVYRFAWCNIAATGFEDGRSGLFVQRDVPAKALLSRPQKFVLGKSKVKLVPDTEKKFVPEAYSEKTEYADGWYFVNKDLWGEVEEAPLIARAWVTQERLLAPRIIHFGRRQMVWECCSLEACEMFPQGNPRHLKSRHVKEVFTEVQRWAKTPSNNKKKAKDEGRFRKLNRCWGGIVASYSAAGLSIESDKLIAISGVARELQQAFQYEYVMGMWKESLHLQLLWSSVKPVSRRITSGTPTWSWACIGGEVIIGTVNLEQWSTRDGGDGSSWRKIEFGKVVDVKIDCSDGPTRPGAGAGLRIRGPLRKATFTRGCTDVYNPKVLINGTSVSMKILPDAYAPIMTEEHENGDNLDLSPPHEDSRNPKNIFCLPVSSRGQNLLGLLLQPSGVHMGHFQRKGVFIVNWKALAKGLPGFKTVAKKDQWQALDVEKQYPSAFKVFQADGHGVEEGEYEEFDGIDQFTITIV